MSILKEIFCKEKVRVLPVEIEENDYKTAVEKNTRKVYGDQFSKYGYIYKKSIVMYQVQRFATQDTQTQTAALLFTVQFFAYTIYPPYNTPINCIITKKKESNNQTIFLLQPKVELNEIKKKIFDRNPIYVQVDTQSQNIENQKNYKVRDTVKAVIYMGQPHLAKEQYFYSCMGNIQGIENETYLQKQFENYEEKYILNRNKFLEINKKQKKSQIDIEDINQQLGKIEINSLDEIEIESGSEVESESSDIQNKKINNKKDQQKPTKQQKKLTKKKQHMNTYLDEEDQDLENQESEEESEYDDQDEEEQDSEEEEEEEDEENNQNDYDVEDEIETKSNEKEEIDQEDKIE